MKCLGKYKKAVPWFRLDDIKFDESNFVLRFDLVNYQVSPGKYLEVGDRCKLSACFEISAAKGIFEGFVRMDHPYTIIAFVEMRSKNHCAMFCALEGETCDENYLPTTPPKGILEARDQYEHKYPKGECLLLFYPEGLIKV